MATQLQKGGALVLISAIVAGLVYIAAADQDKTYSCEPLGKAIICDAGISSTGTRCYFYVTKADGSTGKGFKDCAVKWIKGITAAVKEEAQAPVATVTLKKSQAIPGTYTDFTPSPDKKICYVSGDLLKWGILTNGKCVVG